MKKKLDKKMRTLWFIHATIWVVLAGIGLLMMLFIPSEYRLYVMLPCGIVYLIVLSILYLFVVLRYQYYFYYLEEGIIYIERGVIFKHRIVIPVNKMQDVHLSSGPIMRALDLKSVELSTAGSNFVIAGLSDDDANSFIDDIKQLAGDLSD